MSDDDHAGCIDDAKLLEKLAEDLVNNFHLLVKKYEKTIFAIALSMLNNRQDAEEVTIDTFVQAYRSLDKRKPYKRLKIHLQRWLLKIVKNSCINHRRHQMRFKRRFISVSLDLQEVRESVEGLSHGQCISAEHAALQHEENDELYCLLRQLITEYQFTILILKYCDGMSDTEIADTLNRTPPAIKKARERAVQSLRDTLPRNNVHDKSGDQWLERLMMSIS